MINDIGNFTENGVLKYTERDCTGSLGGQFGINPFRPVAADNSNGLSGFEAKGNKSQRKIAHTFQVLQPAYGLPDTEFFFPQGHPAITESPGISNQQTGKALW